MSAIKDTIHVNVEWFDGQDEGDDGHPYYVAIFEEITAVTDGETLDELVKNVREVVDLFLEDVDTISEYNLVPKPRIVIRFEMPENYAQAV